MSNWRLPATFSLDVPDVLIGDAGRLRQVVVNLIGNALKFTQRGEIILAVRMLSQTDHQVELEFAVRDTGIGIPKGKLDDIFEAFEQVDTTLTRRFGGTGLGLAICRKLTELMSGRIWVESQVGRGVFLLHGSLSLHRLAWTTCRARSRSSCKGHRSWWLTTTTPRAAS